MVWGTDISVGEPHCGYAYRTLRKKAGGMPGKYNLRLLRKVGYKLTDEEEAGEE